MASTAIGSSATASTAIGSSATASTAIGSSFTSGLVAVTTSPEDQLVRILLISTPFASARA